MQINKKLLLGSTAAMVALSPLAVQQLQAATATVPAQAEIVAAIALGSTVSLNFGLLSQTTAVGAAQLLFNSTFNAPTGLNPIGGTPTAGSVKVTATPGFALDISAPTQITLKHSTATANTLKVHTVTMQLAGSVTGNPITAPLPTAGTGNETLLIAGTLKSTALVPAGTYGGQLAVTVVYN